MGTRNPFIFNRFRTLSIAMGVYTPSLFSYPFAESALYERKKSARIARFCAISSLLATLAHFMGGGGYEPVG
jgi:hypothetical protein